MSAQLMTWVSSFVLMLFLPRYLGAEDYGRLVYAMSLSSLFAVVMDLGFTMFFVKEIARDNSLAGKYVTNGVILRLIVWVISLEATMAFVVISKYPPQTITVVLILGIANLFFGMSDLMHRVFIGLEKSRYRSTAVVAEKVFLGIVGIALLLLGFRSLAIAGVMFASLVVNLGVSYSLLRKTVTPDPRIDRSLWNTMLRGGLPYMISTLLGFIYYRINILMLHSMTNETVVGWYGVPSRLLDTLMFFPVILNTAVFPVLSRLVHTSADSVHKTSRRILDLTVIVAVPLVVGMAALARPIISVFGPLTEFGNSVILLQILSISVVLVYVDFVFSTVMVSHDKQKQAVVISVLATIVSLTVNYFAIRYFQEHHGNGAIGAAVTTGITELFVMSMSLLLLPKGCFGMENVINAGKAIFGGCVMWVTVWFVETHFHNWVVAGIAGSVVYVLLMFALGVVRRREVELLLHQLPLPRKLAAFGSSR